MGTTTLLMVLVINVTATMLSRQDTFKSYPTYVTLDIWTLNRCVLTDIYQQTFDFFCLSIISFAQLFPNSMITRIMREVIPEKVHIDPSFRFCVQHCVSAFIDHITDEACNKCEREGRKSITGDDILWSIERLGFKNYGQPLRTFLRKYRAIDDQDRVKKRRGCAAFDSTSPPSP